MGTSGNRVGFKVFSINTTVRNPQRNLEFLEHFQKFNGLVFDSKVKMLYLIELVKNGVYKFSNISNTIKEKLDNDIALNEAEIKEAFENNPQATGFSGRVMTQLRALKDQGFLIFSNDKNPTITMTNLAFELISRKTIITDIYAKIMIGLHSNNPARTSLLNKSRVFLNTIFVIDLLKNEWNKLGKEAKGILRHEFKSFVLGMKDCDYKQCVSEILSYRKIYGLEENKDYIEDYLFNKQGLERVTYTTLNDYADEVFRKFEMTGLLVARGVAKYTYYDFSSFEYKKIESLLIEYKGYSCKEFDNAGEYIAFLDSIKLPWIESQAVRKAVIKQKAKNLNVAIKDDEFDNLNNLENKLNQTFYQQALKSKIEVSQIDTLLNELRILASGAQEKSSLDNIPEPLRLEYLLALILGKKYGSTNLESNLIYNENGEPLSYAPAGKADLLYENFSFEATMIKNRNQQLNSETTSVARHFYESKKQNALEQRAMLIAPYIHWDVALFFKFCAKEFDSKLAPISISSFIELIEKSATFSEFSANFDRLFVDKLLRDKTDAYVDSVNFAK